MVEKYIFPRILWLLWCCAVRSFNKTKGISTLVRIINCSSIFISWTKYTNLDVIFYFREKNKMLSCILVHQHQGNFYCHLWRVKKPSLLTIIVPWYKSLIISKESVYKICVNQLKLCVINTSMSIKKKKIKSSILSSCDSCDKYNKLKLSSMFEENCIRDV